MKITAALAAGLLTLSVAGASTACPFSADKGKTPETVAEAPILILPEEKAGS